MKTFASRLSLDPFVVYLILQFSASLFFSLVFTVNMLYQVTVVGLSPLQLVLMGTTLEATIFLFEAPTGILADMKSRRLSIIFGYLIMGLGFILEGSLALVGTVALAQVLWGLGYTFTSGATQAWIVDEIGERRAGDAFLRGSQAGTAGGLVAIPISVLLGSGNIRLPIILGGALMIGLAAFLALTMTEKGFTPAPAENRTTWRMMAHTVRDAQHMIHRQPVLLALLGIGLFYGLYSEGFDRLWTPHLLENFTLPGIDRLGSVVWFGLIRGGSMLLSLGATEWARRHVNTNDAGQLNRWLTLGAVCIVGALAGFGLTRSPWIALALFALIGVAREVSHPLQTAWFNLRIDNPQIRATMFSLSAQVDAVGQIAGGPTVGAVGNVSIRAALVMCAALLSPVLPLYRLTGRRSANAPDISAEPGRA